MIEFAQGWQQVVDSKNNLDPVCEQFVQRIENWIGVPVSYVSTGAERLEGVWRNVR